MRTGLWACVAALCAAAAVAQAEDYPNRPIRVIVGPSSAAVVRLLADKMRDTLGQPIVVESRPGAGGEIAAKAVSSSEPDGHTLLFATTTYTLNTAMHAAHYDILGEFEPVALANMSSFVLVVHPSLPVHNLKELIAYAKAHPGELNCASAGQGTPPHIACELFNKLAGVRTIHVPFREPNAAMNDLLGNHVQLFFAVSASAQAQISGNAVRAIAIASEQRSELFPGIPTMSEAGLPGFVVTGWGAFMAPAGTPKPVIDKFNAAVVQHLADPDVIRGMAGVGLDRPEPYSPAALKQFVVDDLARWNRVIDQSGVPRADAPAK